jgi:hypothetical protein
MSLCVRYVYDKTIREEFLQFIEIHDMSGKGLAGMGYGASSMSGRYNGVQKYIRDEHPGACILALFKFSSDF